MNGSAKLILVAANPRSGAVSTHHAVEHLSSALNRAGFESRVITSLEQLQASAIANWANGTLRAVVSAGGDGTVAALANLLPADIPLLIYPLGTENLLAKHLRLTANADAAVEILQRNETTRIDVGAANGKLFLVMLSCGFDAEVVRQMHACRRGNISRWSYAGPIWRSLMKYRFPQLGYRLDGSAESTAQLGSSMAAWLFVFNVPRYAAALDFCPQACPTDGKLDVCTFQRSGISSGLYYFARLALRSHQRMVGFRHQTCASLIVPEPVGTDGKPIPVPFQIDGDPGGFLPLEVEVLANRLTLFTHGRP